MTVPRQEPRIVAMQPDILTRLWKGLGRMFLKTGCSIDPNGRLCQINAATAPDQADTGCSIDPHGGPCLGRISNAPIQGDTGCSLDPHGRCQDGH
jgi:hypothetical protein